jgi:hypothetical protein
VAGPTGVDVSKSWSTIVAVTVALVLGLGAGGLVEHQRALNESNRKAPAPIPMTVPKASAWFGSKAAAACPALQEWYQALGTSIYFVLAKGPPWEKIRAALVRQNGIGQAAIRSLIPLANSAGKAEIEFVLASLSNSNDVTKKASSSAALLKSQSGLFSERLGRDVRILLQDAQSCAKK